jgi:transcription-repair coupling factor (superfamily II helicase)
VEAVENPGDFAVRGGVVDCFPPAGMAPIRMDHFGDELESLHEIDVATQASDRKITGCEIPCADGARFGSQDDDPLPGALLAKGAVVVVQTKQASVLASHRSKSWATAWPTVVCSKAFPPMAASFPCKTAQASRIRFGQNALLHC